MKKYSTNSLPVGKFDTFTSNGLTVGPSDVKHYPSIPEIVSAEIDSKTDDEGNIHVKISAKARD